MNEYKITVDIFIEAESPGEALEKLFETTDDCDMWFYTAGLVAEEQI